MNFATLARKTTAVLLCVMCIFSALGTSFLSFAAEVEAKSVESSENLTVTYTFTGEDAEQPGYAEGTVTIIPGSASANSGYYVLYFADDNGVLADYKAIGSIKITGKKVSYDMIRKMAIPEGATKLAVFESTGTTVSNPDIANAVTVDIPESKRFNSGNTELRFASLSDIHVNYDYSPKKWLNTLNYLESIGIDLICTSGDATNSGSVSEFTTYLTQITQSSYSGKIWAAMGNHDSGSKENYLSYLADQGSDGTNLYFYKIADNGDVFIFMAQDTLSAISNTNLEDCFSSEQLDWLENLLQKYSNTGVNIFIYEHAAFLNWGPGDAIPGVYVQPINIKTQNKNVMRLKAILEEYKEVIFCTGHSHVAFSELVNFGDNEGDSCRMIHNSSNSQIRTYDASRTSLIYNTNDTDSEGYIVTVYENDIVYRGMDFATHLYLPTACYIMETMQIDHTQTIGIKSIEIDKDKTKTVYFEGSKPTDGDITLIATYEDGTTKTITDGMTVTIYGSSYTVSPDQTQIRETDDSLLVSYGGVWTKFDISMIKEDFISYLTGSGTEEDPYIIATPLDFRNFTKAFENTIGDNANDTNVMGKDCFFKQTADIDMTQLDAEYEYNGTIAASDYKYGFAGVYDGCGHTLNVDISADGGSISIFPYLNGVVMNLGFTGSMYSENGSTAFQIFRAIGKNGAVINCWSNVNYTGGSVRALTYTLYGKVYNYYCYGTADTVTVYPISGSANSSAELKYVYHNIKSNLTGETYTSKFGEPASDKDQVLGLMSDHTSEAAIAAATLLTGYSSSYSADSLHQWAEPILLANAVISTNASETSVETTGTTSSSVTPTVSNNSSPIIIIVIVVIAVAAVIVIVVVVLKKKKKN